MKKLFSFLLTLIVSAGTLFASDIQVDGIWYDFNSSTKTATVTYRGSSYSSYSNEYTGDIVIPASVTYNNVTYSVTSIGDWTFAYCSGLNSVTIPNSVTSIGNSAFFGWRGLTSMTIPNSVTSIGSSAFQGCTGLTSVTIPDSVTSIGNSAFYGCSGLTSVAIGNSVTSIGFQAFKDCRGLTSVTIPNSVTSIESYAFSWCTGLTSVTIPNSVTSIGDYAFMGCTGLTSVTIPNSVTSIGNNAFSNVPNIVNYGSVSGSPWGARVVNGYVDGYFVYTDETKSTLLACSTSARREIIIPNSVTSIGDNAFYNCWGVTSVTIPDSVTSIGSGAFSGCNNITSVVWNAKNGPGYNFGSQVESFTFGDEVEVIPASICSRMNNLTSIAIPNSVTSIGSEAFLSCTGLTSLTIPNSVTSIESFAFYGCTSLKIVINNSALDIVKGSTDHGYVAYYASDVYQGGDVIGDFVFSKKDETDYVVAYTGKDAQVTLPANYRGGSYGVAAYLFYNNTTVKSITLSNSVTSIGDYSFNNCSNLNVVYIGNSVISIGQYAFNSCPQLYKVIMLPNSVPSGINSAFDALVGRITYVGNTNYQSGYNVLGTQRVYPNLNSYFTVDGIVYALSNPSKRTCDIIDCDYSGATTEFTIANSVVYRNVTLSVDSININAFRNNQEITKLTVNNMAGIGDYAFQNCSSLEDVTIQNKGNIGTQAFAGSSTQNPATYTISNVGAIGESAFANCTSIKNLTIDTCVTTIGQSAFQNCSSLEDVTIQNKGNIGTQAFAGSSTQNPATYIISNVGAIGESAFANCSKLQKVQLGNQVSEINQSAFSNCVLLDSIIVPNTVTALGASAFNNCQKLAYVKLSNQLTSIGQSAFAGCSILPELFIPKSVASIGNSTFQKCSALSVVSFEDGSTPLSLGYNASNQGLFYDCPLDSVYIGRELTYTQTASSGYSPFYRSPSLRSVLISNFPTKVEANEFYGCTKLNFVFIGNGVQSIGDYAFSGCSSIDYFSFGSQVQTIGAEAFSDCVAMTRLYSYSLQPPTCGTSALEDIDKWNCTLYIPKGTTSAYSAANQWQDFFFVEENEEGGDGVKYPISVEYDATKGTVTGAGVYNRGAEAVLIATPAEGFVFVEWEDGSTDPERHIFVYQSATYTATFSTPTAIEELHDDEQTGALYDILGRPVSHPSQGIYIRNGKKVLIK